jgi:hypothetical protein
MGEQHGRTRFTFFAIAAFHGALRQCPADAFFFRCVAAKFSQVFAGPLLNRVGLIAPRGAATRVDAARVFEEVRFAAGAFHFRGFAVGQIGHRSSPEELGMGRR